MSENDKPSPDANPATGLLKAVLETARGLPPPLRFAIAFGVLIFAGALFRAIVPSNLVPLLYLLVALCAVGYFVLEIIEKLKQPATADDEVTAPEHGAGSPPPEPANPPPHNLRDEYCRRVFRVCNRLKLEAFLTQAAAKPEAANLRLMDVFTSLDVAGAMTREWDDDAQHFREDQHEQRQRMPALTAVSSCPKLVLLGNPGSGKSSLANYICVCLAADYLDIPNVKRLGSDDGWQLPRLLPVQVLLGEYAAEGLSSGVPLWDFIQRELGKEIAGSPDLSAFAPELRQLLERAEGGGILILDGLDEVPEADATREKLRNEILSFSRDFPHCCILVTARPYAYQDPEWRLDDFDVRTLMDFSNEQVQRFIDQWYDHVAEKDPSITSQRAKSYAAELKQVVQRNRSVKELAHRPLLLTLMASLHRWQGGGKLPDDRHQLYERAVELLLRLWQQTKQRQYRRGSELEEHDLFIELGIEEKQLLRALQEVAYEVHTHHTKQSRDVADIPLDLLAGKIYAASDKRADLGRVERYVIDRAGLLIELEQGKVFAFPHRTFQEYLAACHLADDDDYPRNLRELTERDDDLWREVVLLAGVIAGNRSTKHMWDLVDEFSPPAKSLASPESKWLLALRAAQVLVETSHFRRVPDRRSSVFERMHKRIEQLCVRGALPPADRATAGRILAVFGDRRPGVATREGDDRMPDVLWCDVPGGLLQMGASKDDPDARSDEYGPNGKPLEVDVAPFRISAFPVTNAQFRPFVLGDGYQNDAYWTPEGRQWKQQMNRTQPDLWDDSDWNIANHPVVGVTWFEAVAWCNWFTQQLRERGELTADQQVRLPSEAEWEWTARGPSANKYPWGKDPHVSAYNGEEAGVGRTSAIGIFPDGVCRWLAEKDRHVYDLAGNVWEWCSTKWRENYGEAPDDSLEGSDARVLRGGAWWSDSTRVRCSYRGGNDPDNWLNRIGFRCAQ